MGSLLPRCGDIQQPHYETSCHPVCNNKGFCAFKSHFQSNTRTCSGFLCTMDWIFCHYKGLIFKIGPGVGMFYVEKSVGRGAVGEAAGRLGRAEADRRASVCMHACGCLCVCARMWVLVCACTHVGACVCMHTCGCLCVRACMWVLVCAGVCGLIHRMERECSLTHTHKASEISRTGAKTTNK